MYEPTNRETIQGLADFKKRLAAKGLQILQQWEEQHRYFCFEIGTQQNRTILFLSHEFLDDLPNMAEYQKSVDFYAAAVAGRAKSGPIDLFFCQSNLPIMIEINWPLRVGPDADGVPVTVALTEVTNPENKLVAMCAVHMRHPRNPTIDNVPGVINSIRAAIDGGEIDFYPREEHPKPYQRVVIRDSFQKRTQEEIEQFIGKKAFALGHLDGISEIWALDPWDAEYLGVSPKEFLISSRVLRGEGLIFSNTAYQEYVQCTDKLVASIVRGNSQQTAKKGPLTRLSLPQKTALEAELAAMPTNESVTLIVIDLDNFKAVNDTFKSHTVGDQCLDTVVNLMAEVVGRRGKLYRWGQGDEFAVLLHDTSTEEALSTAERIRRSIDKANPGKQVKVTASVGVCGTDGEGVGKPSDIIDRADKAVYHSKETGKNRVTAHSVKPT